MIYDFECLICNREFSADYKFVPVGSNGPACPTCNGQSKRIFSLTVVNFKDKPTDCSPWQSKEYKIYGTHGDLGQAEKIRKKNQRKNFDDLQEKYEYNAKNMTPREKKDAEDIFGKKKEK